MSDESLAGLRTDYDLSSLSEDSADADPLSLFRTWFEEARRAQVPEPNAMTLCTVGESGRPSSRIVLVKDIDARGIVWYTNTESRKGRELAQRPFASLQFHWVPMQRQVRIEGGVERVSDDQSDAYFESRPLQSRLGAWASDQSAVIASRSVIEQRMAQARAQFGDRPPRPPHWGGYRLLPDTWEFWQGRRSRLHDRLRYRLVADGRWVRERLAP